MTSAVLQAARRVPVRNSLRIRCTCRRSYAASSTSSSASSAPASTKPKSSTPPTAKSPSATDSAASRSSCPPDTILKGVNYLKGQPPVVAMADDAYPEWLWNVLQPRVYEDDGPGGKKERVERRKANRQAIKDRNFMQTQ